MIIITVLMFLFFIFQKTEKAYVFITDKFQLPQTKTYNSKKGQSIQIIFVVCFPNKILEFTDEAKEFNDFLITTILTNPSQDIKLSEPSDPAKIQIELKCVLNASFYSFKIEKVFRFLKSDEAKFSSMYKETETHFNFHRFNNGRTIDGHEKIQLKFYFKIREPKSISLWGHTTKSPNTSKKLEDFILVFYPPDKLETSIELVGIEVEDLEMCNKTESTGPLDTLSSAHPKNPEGSIVTGIDNPYFEGISDGSGPPFEKAVPTNDQGLSKAEDSAFKNYEAQYDDPVVNKETTASNNGLENEKKFAITDLAGYSEEGPKPIIGLKYNDKTTKPTSHDDGKQEKEAEGKTTDKRSIKSFLFRDHTVRNSILIVSFCLSCLIVSIILIVYSLNKKKSASDGPAEEPVINLQNLVV